MNCLKFTIHGRVPSKKNQVNIVVRHGKVCKFPSNAYRAWHKDATQQLIGKMFIGGPVAHITLTFFAPDKRRADMTNKAESIMDLLVDNGVLVDDNWFDVPHLVLSFGGIDRADPRVEIEIAKKI